MANIYVDAGEAVVVDLTDGTSGVHLDATNAKIAWGTGAGTAAKADTTLFTEASEARVVPTVSQPAADTNRWIGTMTADGAKTITNAGLFNSAAGATLIIHGDFTGVVLALGDKIEFTISLQQT
jgi:hypothetical protein